MPQRRIRSGTIGSRVVIVLVGMPGAGKSLASKAASELGIPVYISGDIIRLEARRLGLEPTRSNLGRLMLKIRKDEGMGAVAKRIRFLLDQSDASIVMYEGARSMEEVDELRKSYRVLVIALQASPHARFRRLLRRKRRDQPKTWNQFLERDQRELGVGLGRVIALADRTIENEGSKEDLRRNTRRVLSKIPTQTR